MLRVAMLPHNTSVYSLEYTVVALEAVKNQENWLRQQLVY
jgi:hypothetical protein